MKTLLLIIRWIVGLLFIFSGLVKANDPLGLSYKMQEFFEVWGWHSFNDYTLALSMIMNVFEVVAGVAVIIGWRMKLFSWLLLLLITFFTFLTGYALFSGKIKTCGCFGDCLPLTPAQSFGKDIFLLVLILILFASANKIKSALKPAAALALLLLVTITTTAGQFYVLKHLPFVDCLPYKKGNNLQEQMKMPAGAIPDSLSIVFIYKKNGKQLEFDQLHFPADFDSTYEYVDRHDKVVRKGNGLQPKILDFSLQTMSGTDTTAAVLGQSGKYLMVMARNLDDVADWSAGFEKIKQAAQQKNLPVLFVTADADKAAATFPNATVVKCDATVLKTAARVTPTYFIMQGANVLSKTSYTEEGKVLKEISSLK
ncbi:MAG: BT_3928 family protein [Bacteroidota bacterium]